MEWRGAVSDSVRRELPARRNDLVDLCQIAGTELDLEGTEIVDQLCVAGTPEMCRQRVQEYLDAGASYPVLCPMTDNISEIIDAFAPGL